MRIANRGQMDRGLKLAIRHFRERSGLTQEEAAARADLSKGGKFSDLERERGRAMPLSLKEIADVAEALDTTLENMVRKARQLDTE